MRRLIVIALLLAGCSRELPPGSYDLAFDGEVWGDQLVVRLLDGRHWEANAGSLAHLSKEG